MFGLGTAHASAQTSQADRAWSAARATIDRQHAATAIVKQKTAESMARQLASASRQMDVTRAKLPPLASNWSFGPYAGSYSSGTFEAWRADCPQVPATDLTRMIATASQKAGVDPELVREVARQESAFRPCSVSDKGAEGLMQLMPATQAQFGVQDPMDPDQSLLGGAQLLRQLLLRYGGNVALALSAYNAGPTRVDKAGATLGIDQIGGIPDIAETQDYVANIMGRLKR